MKQYLIMCRSLTNAQKSKKLLEHNGIFGSVVKAPNELSSKGCGYAVSLRHDMEAALAILKRSGLISGKIYERAQDGKYSEVVL